MSKNNRYTAKLKRKNAYNKRRKTRLATAIKALTKTSAAKK
jgi:hypothetical protein